MDCLQFCRLIILVICLLHSYNVPVTAAPSLCHVGESSALLELKDSFSFDPFASEVCDTVEFPSRSKMDSWNESADCCTWDGVTCDGVNGRVVGLELSCSWLTGSFHSSSSLFTFRYLRKLNLAFNSFNDSSIPSEFGLLQSLTHLNLSNSGFTGQVPAEISHLSRLVSLDLSTSLYTLTIEGPRLSLLVQRLSKLRELIFDQVDMSIASAQSFRNLSSSLASLSLFNCDLHGQFPESVFHLPNLESLVLANNLNVKGYIPEFNRSSPLKLLDLSSTSFSGKIPFSIHNLKSLKKLDLSHLNNTLKLPASIGNLTQLTHLNLEENHISGKIPSSLSNLHNITNLELGHITLDDCFPDIFGNMNVLEYLDLSQTNPGPATTCQFPSFIFSKPKLVYLNFQGCQLVGSFPSRIREFPNLVSMDLSHNFLDGTIPSWLFSLPSLEELYLQNNQLTGQIDGFPKSHSLKHVFLNSNQLHGFIPRSISNLVKLTFLSLSSNNFSGVLDFKMFSTLGNLTFLDLSNNNHIHWSNYKDLSYEFPSLITLYLASCNMSEFPYFLEMATNMERLDLARNKITGRVPKWMIERLNSWENLDLFDIRSNLLEGSLPIPPTNAKYYFVSDNKFSGEIPSLFCKASSLEVLDLSNNSLSGVIPQCFGNFSATLSVLDLQSNNFRGLIPETLAVCGSLTYFNLNGNRLEGKIPHSLVDCQSLEVLDIGNNVIKDAFPLWLDTLPNIKVLVLHNNKFHSTIGNSKTESPFPQLQILDLSSNQFSGHLPANYFRKFKAISKTDSRESSPNYIGDNYYRYSVDYPVELTIKGQDRRLDNVLTIFAAMDFSNNGFSGEIPSDIGKLVALKGLNLSHNHLGGEIPRSLKNLTGVEWLDLSSNNLVGMIPRELAKVTSLAKLNLSYNQLTGPIPEGGQFNTFPDGSFVGNSGLCGAPLSRKCNNNDENSASEEHDGRDSIWGFNWKTVTMGYGCGTIIGLLIGYLVILTGKPKLIMTMVEEFPRKKSRKPRKSTRKPAIR